MGVFSVAWWVCPWRVCSLEGLFPSGCVLSCLVGVFPGGSVSLGMYFPWFKFYLQHLMELIQVGGFCQMYF